MANSAMIFSVAITKKKSSFNVKNLKLKKLYAQYVFFKVGKQFYFIYLFYFRSFNNT